MLATALSATMIPNRPSIELRLPGEEHTVGDPPVGAFPRRGEDGAIAHPPQGFRGRGSPILKGASSGCPEPSLLAHDDQ